MPETPATPPVSRSIHAPLIEQSLPAWATAATALRRAQFKQANAPLPDWYRQATLVQRQALGDAAVAGFSAQTRLDKAVATVQDIDAFAEPLLVKALQDTFNVQLDVHKTLLCLRKPVDVGVFHIEISSFEVLRLPLLQAALHNFEEAESEHDAFHVSSGFIGETAPGKEGAISTTLTVTGFIRLCRTLDIGALYQAYLKAFFYPEDGVTQQVLRLKFVAAQKTALAAAAQLALLKKDIEPDDYAMILSVINGNNHPQVGGRPVWFRDLSLMKHRMTGCVVFVICEKYRYTNDLILYIPNDPFAPLKRHTWTTLDALFKQRFTTREANDPTDGNPSSYQRFFSQFFAYGDRPDYFDRLTEDGPQTSAIRSGSPFVSLINQMLNGINPFSAVTSINQLPPGPPPVKVPDPDPYLAPSAMLRKGHGIWADNIDLWDYLFDRHREQLVADARSHAVPTADVDARVRSEKLAHLLNIGMLVLNAVAMLVPVLGEVMMGVMASQLLYETFEGTLEWAEGDRKAAKAHLVDVAENLALLVVMAGAGKGLAKLVSVKPAPLIEALEPVTSADGKTRLWKAGLEPYESPVVLKADTRPNELGQFRQDGKTYIRQAGKVYEKTWDESAQRWRIRHPSDTQAYQPLLSHNGAGAWRHVLEKPLSWDRLTLLRRMGHVTESFSGEQLLNIADISGVDDNALRKMHMDNAPPPAALSDTLRLFEADQGVAKVIAQVQSGQALDEHALYLLPLVTEMPRWPQGRMLEVFDAGSTLKYGVRPQVPRALRKPTIRVSRADVLNGHLPARILAALDETEIVRFLGGEPARVHAERPGEFSKQIADYARTRQPALFESLYQGSGPKDPLVARLQRLYPGLGEQAAQAVLADADATQLAHLQATGRVPLPLQEHARWQVKQGRLRHAFAGLYMENIASASSRRLALHTLAELPGWPNSLRLEVREGHIEGPLLDAVGSDAGATRKYLVKKGPFFQAFNERGEALNNLPRHGDNFYASIMHALPDEARRSLGVPEVGQSLMLRRSITDHATSHPLASQRIVEGAQRRPRWFKPPRRLSKTQVGYPASGRGEGVAPSLVSRVQAVYPSLTEGEANGFVFRRMLAGDTDQQIVNMLNNRLREWQSLEGTLDRWATEGTAQPRRNLFAVLSGRQQAAQALKNSWRNSPLAELPERAQLSLYCDAPLPVLEADFSHVRTLSIGGEGFTAASVAQAFRYFPEVENLTLIVNHPGLRNVPGAMSQLPKLKRLTVASSFACDAEQVAHVERLTQLETLTLDGMLEAGRVLDVSRMRQLRSLILSRTYQPMWPTGVLDLPLLERLDLRGTGIRTLPPQMFEAGNERLWKGLSLDWSQFAPDDFRQAYDYVTRHPEHLLDREEMVRDYCKGGLLRLLSPGSVAGDLTLRTRQSDMLLQAFLERWPDASARFEAIEALSAQYQRLTQPLKAWRAGGEPGVEFMHRYNIVGSLEACWYNGVMQRYGLTGYASTLDLSSVALSELPPLPEQGFEHIQVLTLKGLRVPEQQLGGFFNRFSGLQTLNLSDCALTQLPMSSRPWAALEHLDLSHNPLNSLDVSTMPRLQALGLSHCTLQTLPVGVESLTDLTWLDLRHTQLVSLPETALASDTVMFSANLYGTPLNEVTRTALAAALRRVEQARGLSTGTLGRFALDAIPEQFPPAETALSISRQLLPLPAPVALESTLEQHLARLMPTLQEHELQAWVARMRSEGLADDVLTTRLNGWNQQFDALTRRLNDWLFMREAHGTQWAVSSQSRGQAALRIVESWRAGLRATEGVEGVLDLEGLQLGDLPEPPVRFDHVATLNLAGARISEDGSNGFLRAFGQLRTLNLNSNLLAELPAAVGGMGHLERLDLAGNLFSDPQPLLGPLQRLAQLQRLDLSQNRLPAFSINRLPQLRALDLSSNSLEDWPEGTLQSRNLHTLNLSNNSITTIPAEALDGTHDALMTGVDLSDNVELSRESLEQLQQYAAGREPGRILGIRRSDIDDLLAEPNTDSEDSDIEPDEELPDPAPSDQQSAAWLEGMPPDQVAEHRRLWAQLENEPDNAAFFHLLSRLQDTEEYRLARADLTRRVWQVVKAANDDSELRQTLFAMSTTHGTCVDGRMLTFSNLEIKVFEHDVLLDIDPARLDLKGPALLKLSRQLFRLDKIETLANQAARPGADVAEVRLSYRIGAREALELPAQPAFMRFARPIRGPVLEQTIQAVQRAESSEAFYEFLIHLDYWTDYLKEKYLQEFATLEQRRTQRLEQIEGTDYASTQLYAEALNMLDVDQQIERNQLLITLSQRETGEGATISRDANQPGPSQDRT
ncbi:NEL-type E3 ubiquitin ligase domain-containing protein [Pseudomonas costantinii]|uniref:RING-type E3 ubiquitin transferase n=1 Tax=Pseudomonas costantinii TaxID=168469 RepID=A0A1S2V8P9_9PSED|nr:NEL-type E3 ubiquitin ligase domain-containing protein [Pseudomonas costantinii]NVZ18825.1 hypothetical protein [Pseudomonas costantinii]OIN55093.1 hypothetical protein BFL40_01940 [Pseudomonas costantinii]SEE12348.1 Leucine rich repeat-containing protein [Pseudomonas costantinii]